MGLVDKAYPGLGITAAKYKIPVIGVIMQYSQWLIEKRRKSWVLHYLTCS